MLEHKVRQQRSDCRTALAGGCKQGHQADIERVVARHFDLGKVEVNTGRVSKPDTLK